jgi:predicted phage terminase large subunit-like protein
VSALSPTQQAAGELLLNLVGPLRLRSCPLLPTPRQEAFLRLQLLEVLYGGGAGGGKTIALLMSALQYCDVPGYHALILRPSLPEFDLPGGLIDLSHDWLAGSKAQWSGETRTWRFPGPGPAGTGGASLRFGYLDGIKDVHRYSGSSFSYLGFDELVRFAEPEYRRMFRVLRQPNPHASFPAAPDGLTLVDVPVRARATSNPGGGPGHGWVKAYFVDPTTRSSNVAFMPSRLTDNPHLDHDQYIASLSVLPHAERERLLHGDWEIPDDGDLFQRSWFELIERHQLPHNTRAVRFWDLAATEPSPANPDPDYTVGLRLDLHDTAGIFYVTDIVRIRKAPGAIEQLVTDTATRDGKAVGILIEEEPGAAGRAVTDRYKQHVLRGYSVKSKRATGPKDVRAQPAAAAAENGLLKIVRSRTTNELLDELCAFPHGAHDDCVDALAGAHQALSPRGNIPMRTYVPRGRIPTQEDRFSPFW